MLVFRPTLSLKEEIRMDTISGPPARPSFTGTLIPGRKIGIEPRSTPSIMPRNTGPTSGATILRAFAAFASLSICTVCLCSFLRSILKITLRKMMLIIIPSTPIG